MLRLPDFMSIDTTNLWLNISSSEQQKAYRHAQCYSNPTACYNAYLNSVCLYQFLNWLQDWLREEYNLSASVFPSEQDITYIWEVVSGAAIQFGNTRLVLIPTETLDLDVLCVPQEWVDIESWKADYYVAIQINLDGDDDCWMRVCGFTTHRQLKNQGICNEDSRTYCLPLEALADNIISVFTTLELNLQVEVPSIVSLSEAEVTNLLHILGDASVYTPRLFDIPFTKWAALISNSQWRQQLYNRRLGIVKNVASVSSVKESRTVVNLNQWFEKFFEAGWQSLDALVDTHLLNLALEYRSSHSKGLTQKGAKLIDLGMQISGKSVALLLAISTEAEGKTGVIAQVHPTGDDSYLPLNLKLSLVESGNVLQEIQSRSRDCYIQLNHFKVLPGANFSIRLVLGEFSITEDFVI
ncbi:hypothetical protein NIES2101_17910 [Calothrix sp. HK-06]|nr:hypothetical protein NIES2101_17910 [Calothrix sp. HK-06]